MWDVLRARLEGRFTTTELFQAYRAGNEALGQLAQRHSGSLLLPLLNEYIRECPARGGEKTKTQVVRFLGWFGDASRVSTQDFTSGAVAKFLSDLQNLNTRQPVPASAATKNRYRAALQGFATWLVKRRHMATHPIAGL